MKDVLDRLGTSQEKLELRAELMNRAEALIPMLRENASKASADKRLPEENITALEQAGLFTMMISKRYGGYKADFHTMVKVVAKIAEGCGATAWTLSIMDMCSFFVGYWNEKARLDVWGTNPQNRIAGVLAPVASSRVTDGGFRLSGRWPFASGAHHAQWYLVGATVADDKGDTVDDGLLLVPKKDVVIEDTWYTQGTERNGANTIHVPDAFVPAHRFVSTRKLLTGRSDNPHHDDTLHRTPFTGSGTVILGAPFLGMAKASLEYVLQHARKRGIAYTCHERRSGLVGSQAAIAQAASKVDIAELLLYRAAADIDAAVVGGEFPGWLSRARCRMDTVQSIAYARDAIQELAAVHGVSRFATSSPLSHHIRHAEIASRHAVANSLISPRFTGGH